MAKRKTLPKDFEQLVQTASDEDIKKVLGKCDINAYGGYNKGNALEFPLSEEMMRWLIEQRIDINYVATHRCFIMLEECHQRNRQ